MTKNLITATKNNTRKDIIEMMVNKNIHHIPIIKDDIVIGIISPKDLVFKESQDIKEIMSKRLLWPLRIHP